MGVGCEHGRPARRFDDHGSSGADRGPCPGWRSTNRRRQGIQSRTEDRWRRRRTGLGLGEEQVGETDRTATAEVPDRAVGALGDAAWQHGAALKLDGPVWTWGANEYGQRGNGTDEPSGPPTEARDMFAATALAAGANHSMALHPRGPIPSGVWSWGYNFGGVLGDGTTYQERTRPTETLLADATQVAGGDLHSLAVRHDGSVWAWGLNNFGQLGATGIPSALVPREVAGLTLIPPGGLAGDPDGGGLLAWDELRLGTNPFLADSNGDGIGDSLSLTSGIDATNVTTSWRRGERRRGLARRRSLLRTPTAWHTRRHRLLPARSQPGCVSASRSRRSHATADHVDRAARSRALASANPRGEVVEHPAP